MMWFQTTTVPVRSMENSGITIMVSSVDVAVEQLESWPMPENGRRGPKWRKAYKKCFDALEGMADAKDARDAFEAAAIEAGVLRQGR